MRFSPFRVSWSRVRTATLWIGTLRVLSSVLVITSAVAVMPGRSVWGGSAIVIRISNSVFWSVVPVPETFALLEICETTPPSV